jgi:hypothetical protein
MISNIIKKITNARRKAVEKTLPPGAKEKLVKELNTFLIFLEEYVTKLAGSEDEIKTKIQAIQDKTKQNLKAEQLLNEIWVLRYVSCVLWFFGLKPPQDQKDVEINLALINKAFLNVKETADYFPLFAKGFVEYAGEELEFSKIKELERKITEKIAEKIPSIAFDCTEGRLGGELHDFVLELIMTTVMQDKELFTGATLLTEKEKGRIKETINKLGSERDEAARDFFNSL